MRKKGKTMLRARLILAMLIVIFVAAACSKGNSTDNTAKETSSGTAGASSTAKSSAATENVEIKFFQHKVEAKDIYDKIIVDFEKKYPHIKVSVLANQQDYVTYLKSRAATDDLPDVIASTNIVALGSMAKGGLLKDLNGTPQAAAVFESYIANLKREANTDQLVGYPNLANARGIIYNKTMFESARFAVPKTWDELIALCKAIKAKGELAFTFSYQDAWTTGQPLEMMAAQISGADFVAKLTSGETTFGGSEYKVALEKLLELNQYGTKPAAKYNYDQAITAFANGESYMTMQGNWAIPAIIAKKPDIQLGFIPLPTTNNPEDTKIVAGIDQVLSIAAHSKHLEAAETFVNYLMTPEVSGKLTSDQKLLPTIQGVENISPILDGIKPYIDQGKTTEPLPGFYPPSFSQSNIVQEFLIKGKLDETLGKLQSEFKKALKRQ